MESYAVSADGELDVAVVTVRSGERCAVEGVDGGKLQGTKRTKRVADRKVITDEGWSEVVQTTWQKSHKLLEDAVQLNFYKPDYRVLMSPDASDVYSDGSVTSVGREFGE